MDDLVKRLRLFAQGCRGSKWQSRDKTVYLCDEAADTIEALTARAKATEALAEEARNKALEDAAKVADKLQYRICAAAIRALKSS